MGEECVASKEWTSANGSAVHRCNCIGCCQKCGQCRTNPLHAGTCEAVSVLNKERDRILAEEADRLRESRSGARGEDLLASMMSAA